MKLQYQNSANSTSLDERPVRLRLTTGPKTRLLQRMIIAITSFLGGFVLFEPAPYELILAVIIVVWFAFGLRIPRLVLPLLLLIIGFNAGGIIASFQMEDHMRGILYVATSLFLGLTSVFFAIILSKDTKRIEILFKAYLAAAVLTCVLGILGYFNIPGFALFSKFERASGAFQDPNVFAPYLVIPILYMMHGIMRKNPTGVISKSLWLAILTLGLFLAFSRAAWGLAVASIAFFYCLQLINERDRNHRFRLLFLAAMGFTAIIAVLAIALQNEDVSQSVSERGQLVQSYDSGETGRFALHVVGLEMSLAKPLGIGPLEFFTLYGANTHNTFLKASLSYGWIGFLCWTTMLIWTLVVGSKLLFRQRPWQMYLQIAYTVFLWHIIISYVIDIDHWRHFYLMIGIIWSCILLEARWQFKASKSEVKGNIPVSRTT